MNHLVFLIKNLKHLLFIFLLVLFSCNGSENTSAFDDNQEKGTLETKANSNKPTAVEDERSNWQKPQFIIQSLGDLTDKTVADIGAGALGYFVFKLVGQTNVNKIIAIDIDKNAVNMLNILKGALSEDKSERIDIRLAQESDPKLEEEEVDIILIVNTVAYIPKRLQYFDKLRSKLKENGKLVIVDFKTKRIPDFVGAPNYADRVYLDKIEEELFQAGYNTVITDDTSLDFQYYISAGK